MARVFPFIPKAKHKTLHVKWAWVELENSAKKQSAQASIDRVNNKSCSTLNSNFTHKHTLSKSKTKLNLLVMVFQHYKLKF